MENKSKARDLNIKNRRASFEYSFLEKFVAGMKLAGTEIKSLRAGKANISDAFCVFIKDELWVRNMQIEEYDKATYFNHEAKRDRKLLLTSHELKKISNKLKDQGLTVVPLKIFISDTGYAKLEIAVAKGKKLYDKREDIKKRDVDRDLKRKLK